MLNADHLTLSKAPRFRFSCHKSGNLQALNYWILNHVEHAVQGKGQSAGGEAAVSKLSFADPPEAPFMEWSRDKCNSAVGVHVRRVNGRF